MTALDSLKRRGSEPCPARPHEAGVAFRHGDIRRPEDLEGLPPFDLPPARIVRDIRLWIEQHRETLRDVLA